MQLSDILGNIFPSLRSPAAEITTNPLADTTASSTMPTTSFSEILMGVDAPLEAVSGASENSESLVTGDSQATSSVSSRLKARRPKNRVKPSASKESQQESQQASRSTLKIFANASSLVSGSSSDSIVSSLLRATLEADSPNLLVNAPAVGIDPAGDESASTAVEVEANVEHLNTARLTEETVSEGMSLDLSINQATLQTASRNAQDASDGVRELSTGLSSGLFHRVRQESSARTKMFREVSEDANSQRRHTSDQTLQGAQDILRSVETLFPHANVILSQFTSSGSDVSTVTLTTSLENPSQAADVDAAIRAFGKAAGLVIVDEPQGASEKSANEPQLDALQIMTHVLSLQVAEQVLTTSAPATDANHDANAIVSTSDVDASASSTLQANSQSHFYRNTLEQHNAAQDQNLVTRDRQRAGRGENAGIDVTEGVIDQQTSDAMQFAAPTSDSVSPRVSTLPTESSTQATPATMMSSDSARSMNREQAATTGQHVSLSKEAPVVAQTPVTVSAQATDGAPWREDEEKSFEMTSAVSTTSRRSGVAENDDTAIQAHKGLDSNSLLNVASLKTFLASAQEAGLNIQSVEISLPTPTSANASTNVSANGSASLPGKETVTGNASNLQQSAGLSEHESIFAPTAQYLRSAFESSQQTEQSQGLFRRTSDDKAQVIDTPALFSLRTEVDEAAMSLDAVRRRQPHNSVADTQNVVIPQSKNEDASSASNLKQPYVVSSNNEKRDSLVQQNVKEVAAKQQQSVVNGTGQALESASSLASSVSNGSKTSIALSEPPFQNTERVLSESLTLSSRDTVTETDSQSVAQPPVLRSSPSAEELGAPQTLNQATADIEGGYQGRVQRAESGESKARTTGYDVTDFATSGSAQSQKRVREKTTDVTRVKKDASSVTTEQHQPQTQSDASTRQVVAGFTASTSTDGTNEKRRAIQPTNVVTQATTDAAQKKSLGETTMHRARATEKSVTSDKGRVTTSVAASDGRETIEVAFGAESGTRSNNQGSHDGADSHGDAYSMGSQEHVPQLAETPIDSKTVRATAANDQGSSQGVMVPQTARENSSNGVAALHAQKIAGLSSVETTSAQRSVMETGNEAAPRVFRVPMDNFAQSTPAIIKNISAADGGSVRLILSPEALGMVVVNLRMQESERSLNMEVSSQSTKSAIEAQLTQLREQFASNGVRVDTITVTVRESETAQNHSFSQHQQSSQQKHDERESRAAFTRSFENRTASENVERDRGDASRQGRNKYQQRRNGNRQFEQYA